MMPAWFFGARFEHMTAPDGQGSGQAVLRALYDAAVAAAHPDACLPGHLPAVPAGGRLVIAGAGKAAAAMAVAAERHYRAAGGLDQLAGFVTAPHGSVAGLPELPRALRVVEARHPTPDESSVKAAEESLALVRSAGETDLVLVLLSGGASALWAAPATGLSLADKIALTDQRGTRVRRPVCAAAGGLAAGPVLRYAGQTAGGPHRDRRGQCLGRGDCRDRPGSAF
jgi:hypothetical protein